MMLSLRTLRYSTPLCPGHASFCSLWKTWGSCGGCAVGSGGLQKQACKVGYFQSKSERHEKSQSFEDCPHPKWRCESIKTYFILMKWFRKCHVNGRKKVTLLRLYTASQLFVSFMPKDSHSQIQILGQWPQNTPCPPDLRGPKRKQCLYMQSTNLPILSSTVSLALVCFWRRDKEGREKVYSCIVKT